MDWITELHGCPSQSYTFVRVAGSNYGLFISCRPDSGGWRAFVVPAASNKIDLLRARWSADIFAEAGLIFQETQIAEAQAACVRIFASRVGVAEKDIMPLRNGRVRRSRQTTVTGAQIHQIARSQPPRRK